MNPLYLYTHICTYIYMCTSIEGKCVCVWMVSAGFKLLFVLFCREIRRSSAPSMNVTGTIIQLDTIYILEWLFFMAIMVYNVCSSYFYILLNVLNILISLFIKEICTEEFRDREFARNFMLIENIYSEDYVSLR